MIYATSDLHGFPLEKFQEALDRVGFTSEDFCFILGDVVDRGPESVKLLTWLMMQPNIQLILGNHEAMLLSCAFLFEHGWNDALDDLTEDQFMLVMRWIQNGGDRTIQELSQCDEETLSLIVDYLREVPLYDSVSVNGKDFYLVHGGFGNFSPEKNIEDYSPSDLLWSRPKLEERYDPNIITILGHTPTSTYGEAYAGKAIFTPTWINIDTGAGWGGSPMLLRLDDMKEFYL